jgi:hypothetical protein
MARDLVRESVSPSEAVRQGWWHALWDGVEKTTRTGNTKDAHTKDADTKGARRGVTMAVWANDTAAGTRRRDDATPEMAAAFGALLASVVHGDERAAGDMASDLLGRRAEPERVYRVAARALLGRAVGRARGPRGLPHGLWALTAAYYLAEALPAGQRGALLGRAVALAAGDWRAGEPVPAALPPWSPPAIPGPHHGDFAGLAVTRALAGDGAGAEWALAQLLAGMDGGSAPSDMARHAAYAAVMRAAAATETRGRHWGHLLVGAQHVIEMAELLPPAEAFLALRPALWMVARSARRAMERGAAEPPEDPRALARLDAAVLTVAKVLAAAAGSTDSSSSTDASSSADPSALRRRRAALANHAVHTLLALHAARRAIELDAAGQWALASASTLVARLTGEASGLGPRLDMPVPARHSRRAVAAAAARLGTAHAIAVAEAALAEHDALAARAPRTAAAVLAAVGAWLGGADAPRGR